MSILAEQMPETPLNAEQVGTLLTVAHQAGAILIGGQALAYWVEAYGIPIPAAGSISTDSDLFGDLAALSAIGRALGGRVLVQKGPGISALVGLIEVPQADGSFSIVDVLHTISGLDREGVRKRAICVTTASGIEFQVMHPMDVFESRLFNVAKFHDRHTEKYMRQCHLAVDVVNAYIRLMVKDGMEKTALKAIEKVVLLSKTFPGKQAAKFGVNLLKAIPADAIQAPGFHEIRWPQILLELEDHVRRATSLPSPIKP